MRENKIYKDYDVKSLKIELLNLLREEFNLRMQLSSGKSQQTHLLKKARHDIALINMLLSKKDVQNE